jgi:hypothetical protein
MAVLTYAIVLRPALVVSLVFAVASSGHAQTCQSTGGDCSPIFAQNQIGGNVTINCNRGKECKDVEALARVLESTLKSTASNARATAAVLKGMNALAPAYLKQIARWDGRQDKVEAALDQIQTTLRDLVRDDDAAAIAQRLSLQKGKLLTGTELSMCGCWGELKYGGHTEANPQCLSGTEGVIACNAGSTNVSVPTFWRRLFFFEETAYAPWQRACT